MSMHRVEQRSRRPVVGAAGRCAPAVVLLLITWGTCSDVLSESWVEPVSLSPVLLVRRDPETETDGAAELPLEPAATEFATTLAEPGERPSAPTQAHWLEHSPDPPPVELSLSERLDQLEANYASLMESHTQLEQQLETFVEPGHGEETMRVIGRIHFDLWSFPSTSPGVNGFETGNNAIAPADRVGFRRLRLGVGGEVWENMVYRLELEMAGGIDSQFRDAYLGFTDLPIVQRVQIGNQKRPYGLDHWNSSRFNVFIERPFVIEGFNQDNRRLGIESWSHSDDLAYNWQYGVFNQALVQDVGNYISNHWQAQVAGRLARTLCWDRRTDGRRYAHWAVAGTWADTDGNANTANYADSGFNQAHFLTRPEARTVSRWLNTGLIDGAEDYSLLGLEHVLNLGPLQIVGEYQNVWLNRETESQLDFHGGYVYVAYFLTGEYMPWDRETGQLARPIPRENFFLVDTPCDGVQGGCGAWQVAARWSYADFSDRDIQGGVGESITLGLNWYWNPYARLQFNYIYGNIYDNAFNAVDGIDFGDYQILGARFMIDF